MRTYQAPNLDALKNFEYKATHALENANLCLKKLKNRLYKSDIDNEVGTRLYQLVLQYRLDGEDALRVLLSSYQGICTALGIQPSNSVAKNLDIACYHLGKDNLHGELSILRSLAEKLLKALALAQKSIKKQLEEKKQFERILHQLGVKGEINASKSLSFADFGQYKNNQSTLFVNDISNAIRQQAYFIFCIEQLTSAMHDIGHIPKFGLIYDYLAGIKGPISRYQVALQNGLALGEELLAYLSNKLKLNKRQTSVRHQVHELSRQLSDSFHLQQQLMLESNNRLQTLKEMEAKLKQGKELSSTLHLLHKD